MSHPICTAACLLQCRCAHSRNLLTSGTMQAWTEEVGTSSGCLATPAAVTVLLASAACRYAIMFGDELSLEEAGRLLQDLSQTRLCFVCAHGRPTTSPLLNMVQLACHLRS